MSAGIGRGRPPPGMFGYFMPWGIESPVPGLGTGRWHDPGGTLTAFGVEHNDPVTVKNQGTYYALAAGLNPGYFAGAFRSSGTVSPRDLAETIWSLATRRERETIATGVLRSRYKWVLDANMSPSVFRDLVWAAWNGRTAEQIARASIDKPTPASRGRIMPVTPDQDWRNSLLADLLRAAGQVRSVGRLLLTTQPGFERQSGPSLLYAAPRDMTLLAMLSHPHEREMLLVVFDKAVDDALQYVQEYGGQTRVRHDGKIWKTPCRFSGLRFPHGLARPEHLSDHPDSPANASGSRIRNHPEMVVDPHLHEHMHLLNLALDDDGNYRAVEPRFVTEIFNGSQLAFRNSLAFGLKKSIGLELDIDPVAGDFRIRGVPEKVVAAFSHRSARISGQKLSVEDDVRSLRTRSSKLQMDASELVPYWRQRARDAGFAMRHARSILRSARRRKAAALFPENDEPVTAELLKWPSRSRPTMSAEEVRCAVLRTHVGSHETSQLLRACKAMSKGLLAVGPVAGEMRFMSPRGALLEAATIKIFGRRFTIQEQIFGNETWDAIRLIYPLSASQMAVARAVWDAPRHVRICDLPAGIDRDQVTTFLRAALEASGYRIERVDCSAAQRQKGNVRVDKRAGSRVAWVVDSAERLLTSELAELLQRGTRSSNLVLLMADLHHPAAIRYASLLLRLTSPGSGFVRPHSGLADQFLNNHPANVMYRMEQAGQLALFDLRSTLEQRLVEDYFADQSAHPNESQLVLASSAASVKQLRAQITSRLPARAGPPEVLEIDKATNRQADRIYVVQDGLDRVAQYWALSMHRVEMRHYADCETVREWLRQYFSYEEHERFKSLRLTHDQLLEILSLQWSQRAYKVSWLDVKDEMSGVSKSGLLSTLAFDAGNRHRISENKNLLAWNRLRNQLDTQAKERRQQAANQALQLATILLQQAMPDPGMFLKLPAKRITADMLQAGRDRFREKVQALLITVRRQQAAKSIDQLHREIARAGNDRPWEPPPLENLYDPLFTDAETIGRDQVAVATRLVRRQGYPGLIRQSQAVHADGMRPLPILGMDSGTSPDPSV